MQPSFINQAKCQKPQVSTRCTRISAHFISPESNAKQRPETFHASSRVLTLKDSTTFSHIIRRILHTHYSKYPPVPSGDVSTVTAMQQKPTHFYSDHRTTLPDSHKRNTEFITTDFQNVNILRKETYLHIYWKSKLGEAVGIASQVLDTHVRGSRESTRRSYNSILL